MTIAWLLTRWTDVLVRPRPASAVHLSPSLEIEEVAVVMGRRVPRPLIWSVMGARGDRSLTELFIQVLHTLPVATVGMPQGFDIIDSRHLVRVKDLSDQLRAEGRPAQVN